MVGFVSTRVRRLGIGVAAAAAVAVASTAWAPAEAAPPPASVGNVIHGFLRDDDGDIRTVDHPDAATTVGPNFAVTGSFTAGINDDREIVGSFEDRSRTVHNFLRDRRGRFRLVDPPWPYMFTEALDVNNDGDVVGIFDDEPYENATPQGFLRTRRGRFVRIEIPGAVYVAPFKINDHGQIAGFYYTDLTKPGHGFIWDDGEITTIDVPEAELGTVVYGINDRGDTVGSFYRSDGSCHGFTRDRRGRITTVDAPGAETGTAVASINDHGQMVGATYAADGSAHGFVRSRRGRFTSIDVPGAATSTRALDVNNHGVIVGDYDTEPPTPAA